MAIAGGAVPAVRVSVMTDGTMQLRIEPTVAVQHEVAVGVDDALDELHAGRMCYLKLYGGNLDALKRRWQQGLGEL